MDEFRAIPGYPGYEITRTGIVRSIERKIITERRDYIKPAKVLAPKTAGGYLLCFEGRRTSEPTLRLVALAWDDLTEVEIETLRAFDRDRRQARPRITDPAKLERQRRLKRESDRRRREARGGKPRVVRTTEERREYQQKWQRAYRDRQAASRPLIEEAERVRSPLTFPIQVNVARMRELVERGVSLPSVAAAFRLAPEQVAEVLRT